MRRIGCVVSFLIFLPAAASSAALVEFDMGDASQWDVIADDDTEAVFGFDYSQFGIPEAPGGGDTLGLQLAANTSDPGGAAGIAAAPKGFVAQGKYTAAVDVWMNYYADPGKVGTTEFSGVFIGVGSVTDGIFDGAGLVADTDGDTSRDYRLYNNGSEVSLESGQYDIESQDNTDEALSDAFPGQETPDVQTDLDFFDPPNEFVIADDGTQGFGWHTWLVEADPAAGTARFSIDGLVIGTLDNGVEDDLRLEGNLALVLADLFSSVAPVPDFAFTVFDNLVADIESQDTGGDYDGDGQLGLPDIRQLGAAIRAGNQDSRFDANQDGDVDLADHEFWILELRRTWFGDANLDGEFTTQDFVSVFQKGQYEDSVAGNSAWDDGDWNGDGDFDSGDFVKAFQDGGFEIGPKPPLSADVPEPGGLVMLLVMASIASFAARRRTF